MNFQPLVSFFCVITLVTFESYLAILWALLGFFVATHAKLPPSKPFLSSSCCLLLHSTWTFNLCSVLLSLNTMVTFEFLVLVPRDQFLTFPIQTLSSSCFMILPKALKIYDLSYNIYRFTSHFTVNFHLFTVYRSYMFCKASFLIRILLAVFTFEL